MPIFKIPYLTFYEITKFIPFQQKSGTVKPTKSVDFYFTDLTIYNHFFCNTFHFPRDVRYNFIPETLNQFFLYKISIGYQSNFPNRHRRFKKQIFFFCFIVIKFKAIIGKIVIPSFTSTILFNVSILSVSKMWNTNNW